MFNYDVIIIGSGFSGICQAIKFKEQGISNFIILEKSKSIGGTWRDNTYPGAACDIPSIIYNYSFEQNKDWKRKWSGQKEILDYIHKCSKKYNLEKHIIFNSELKKAEYSNGNWLLKTQNKEYVSNSLVLAVGQLHHPKIPKYEGYDDFMGAIWHSAQWNHEIDLKNKNIVVIGNAASAVQFIPKIAAHAKKLTVLQRTSNWILPKKEPKQNFLNKKLKKLSFIRTIIKQKISLESAFVLSMIKNNQLNQRIGKWYALNYMKSQIKNSDLRNKLIPEYPISSKRILFSDDYYPTLCLNHVHLETNPIKKITQAGVLIKNNTHIDADIIIFATGFETNPFYHKIDIIGKEKKSLSKEWKNGAEAYLGITTSGFPNLYMLYGPNTNIGHNSIIAMSECQANYILKCITAKIKNNWNSIEVKNERLKDYNTEIHERLKKTSWNLEKNSWYITSNKITNNWPGSINEYSNRIKNVDFKKDYIIN